MCSFSVAVNRRRTQQDQQPEADFFSVTAWRQLGENCGKFLTKGSKVCVIGPVSVRLFNRSDGTAGASLEMQANDVEFLSSPNNAGNSGASNTGNQNQPEIPTGFTQVETGELPF